MSKPCHECGGDTEWFAMNTNPTEIADGRLKVNDVRCVFVRGCTDCSETLEVRTADEIAKRMNGGEA